MKNVEQLYQRWREKATADDDIVKELEEIAMLPSAIEDRFYKDLTFGTGGLRGIIGAGTNRMNIYTVAKASQGLSNYINQQMLQNDPLSIAISYDSRIKSLLFAQTAASVCAANGIKVYIYKQLMPTPCLSFAVRELKCAAGIMVTASHNQAEYNGYKVYDSNGCQITTAAANQVLEQINAIDAFDDVKMVAFEDGFSKQLIEYIDESVERAFAERVQKESLLPANAEVKKDMPIVYSPLNGTGRMPVLHVLNASGFTNIIMVKEQEQPDGNFPTCPIPNPENKDAMILGIEYAKKYGADLCLATDPDCDRVGIAVKNRDGAYSLLSGNETGILLTDYICKRRCDSKTMPQNPVIMKTIVTSDMAERIAAHYGVGCINVLTGFKFIGEQIGLLEKDGHESSYIFGLEESYGYLSGTYVRDKDAVNATLLICEMFSYYKTAGISLWDKLQELYMSYGYELNVQHSYSFEGVSGAQKMKMIMQEFHNGVESFAGKKVLKWLDYSQGIDGLPKADVLKYWLEDDCSIVIRPSGTEPKLKTYFSVMGENEIAAKAVEMQLDHAVKDMLNAYLGE